MENLLHSPLPWSYDGVVIRDAKGNLVMDQLKPHVELDANAKLIVSAVNHAVRTEPQEADE